jgi:Holliday junction resolvase RusA-like endonuclease
VKRLLLKVELDIEPVTWGDKEAERREEIRQAIKEKIPDFGLQYMEQLLGNYDDIEVVLNCYLNSMKKDIDNLAKIPIDGIFYSAQNEAGYKDWERKITSLILRKLQHPQNKLEIIIYGTTVR